MMMMMNQKKNDNYQFAFKLMITFIFKNNNSTDLKFQHKLNMEKCGLQIYII